MSRCRIKSHAALFSVIVAGAVLALSPTPVGAYPGICHWWATEAATELFGVGQTHPNADPMEIDRNRPVPLFPELELATEWYDPHEGCCDDDDLTSLPNWDWVNTCSMAMDSIESDTRHHFWQPADGLHESVQNPGMNNAWETVHNWWTDAIDAWQEGSLGKAYASLGYSIHFIEDGGQPAHANEDMHPGDGASDDDSYEDWISVNDSEYCRANFHWNAADPNAWPGPILYPPHNNAEILNTVLNSNGGYWDEDQDTPIEPDTGDWAAQDEYFFNLSYPYSVYNKQQLFYIMYVVNQTGNYFASDGEDGDSWEGIGWLNQYPGFPLHLHTDCSQDFVTSVHSKQGLYPDNDEGDTDCDGDLSLIAHWAYAASFRAAPAMIDLFRRSVDAVPPVSTVETSRADGQPMREWNNSPVTVKIVSAEDFGNPYLRVAGVWKRWGKVDGVTPSFMANADQTPYWLVTGDGSHHVELLSIDTIGNVETGANDFDVQVDQTPPEVTFPDLRPNYLTSESFTATWNAWDATSGIDSEVAYLDNVLVSKGQVFNLAQMAGLHTLRVIAYDKAQNWRDVEFRFEVWIAANGWCLPVNVVSKTKGEAMTCVVEFPAFYNVGLIELASARIAAKGHVDLDEQNPVVGQTANLPATLLTGVGDHDKDGVADRKLRFDKDAFVAALYGETGNVPSVIHGGLLPSGLPRYLAPVIVTVFSSPR